MLGRSGESSLEFVFGRAFLVALERGNLSAATAFARAFLEQHAPTSGDSDLTAERGVA